MHAAAIAHDGEPTMVGDHMVFRGGLLGAADLAIAIVGDLGSNCLTRHTRVLWRRCIGVEIAAARFTPVGVSR